MAGHPIHAMLGPAPLVCFVSTCVTDIVYAKTASMMWADMSAWLLAIGLIVSIFVVIAGVVDHLGDRRIRAIAATWIHGLGNGVALLLAIVDSFVHSRDAYTSVVPTGLILSGLVC